MSSSSSTTSSSPAAASSSASSLEAEAAALFVFCNDKAGMRASTGHTAAKAALDASKGSAFYARAKRQDQLNEERIQEMQERVRVELEGTADPQTQVRCRRRLECLQQQVTERIVALERGRNLTRICAVLDFDMFYAAVEMRDNPALRGKPIAVGGIGMISTANYEARKYGVRSAQPGFIAKKLCPELIFVKGNFDKYREASEQMRVVCAEFDPFYSSYSLDEVYLDLTHWCYCELAKEHGDLGRQEEGTEDDNEEEGIERAASGREGEESDAASGDDDSDDKCDSNSDNDSDRDHGADALAPAEGTATSTATATATATIAEGDTDSQQQQQKQQQRPGRLPFSSAVRKLARQLIRRAERGDERLQRQAFRAGQAALARMRSRICTVTGGLTVSGGIANTFMLAKVAADVNKPNGQHGVPPTTQSILEFIHPLPVRKIGGCGKVLQKWLHGLGVDTCGELRGEAMAKILHVGTPALVNFLLRVSIGMASDEDSMDNVTFAWRHRMPDGAVTRKSIGRERTFGSLRGAEPLRNKLRELCAKVAKDMVKRGRTLKAHTVTLKLKTVTYEVRTRAATSATYIHTEDDIYALALPLLEAELPSDPVLRLMGVRMSHFQHQMTDSAAQVLADRKQTTLSGMWSHHQKTSKRKKQDSQSAGASEADTEEAAEPEEGFQEGEEADGDEDEEDESGPFGNAANHAPRDYRASDKRAAAALRQHAEVVECDCPVCGEHLRGGQAELSAHVDRCLSSSASASASTSSSSSSGPAQSLKAKPVAAFWSPLPPPTAIPAAAAAAAAAGAAGAAPVTTTTCPLCAQHISGTEAQLSTHVDRCLLSQRKRPATHTVPSSVSSCGGPSNKITKFFHCAATNP